MSTDQKRSLTVFCPLGLSNRLRVLLSGLALAEATGRQFKMLWPLTPACAAPFAELFANDWPVETVLADAVTNLPYISGWFGQLPDLMFAQESDLIVGHPSWLVQPEQFPGHRPLTARCQAIFAELQPAPLIQEQIDGFQRQHFRSTMIGVHLRRGDMLRARPDVAYNTAQALTAVDEFIAVAPDAGILLCTDDGAPQPGSHRPTHCEGIREKFAQRYGGRMIAPIPRSLDRASSIAVQDAVHDLYLLRACDYFVGTEGSSFSQLAVFAQTKPHSFAKGAKLVYRWFAQIVHWVGFDTAISARRQHQPGTTIPHPVLFRYYSRASLRWLHKKLGRGTRG